MEVVKPDCAKVALWKGQERTANLRDALLHVVDGIDWASRQAVLIKPNLVKIGRPYAVTHPDALATVLAVVRERYSGPLTIAEGCAEEPTSEFFKLQGIDELADEYEASLIDLNADESVPITVYNQDAKPLQIRLARQVIKSDCRISLCLPKTHDTVLVTLSIKNMAMGSLINRRLSKMKDHPAWFDRLGRLLHGHGNGWGSDKVAMHQGYPVINLNLARLATFVRPHLSVVDGFIGMEGAGPLNGKPVPWGVVVAGTDALAVDTLTAHLMGFEIDHIGYLSYCAQLGLGCSDLERIEIVGNTAPQTVARSFAPHPQHRRQLHWQHPRAVELLK